MALGRAMGMIWRKATEYLGGLFQLQDSDSGDLYDVDDNELLVTE
jgi:hypothetical protein